MSAFGTQAQRHDPRVEGLRDQFLDSGVGEPHVVYQGMRFPLVAGRMQAGGEEHEREWSAHPGAVAVIATRAMTPDHGRGDDPAHQIEAFLLQQYRHPVNALAWEIPAGLLDVTGESMVEAAARELAEEAELRCDEWSTLVDFHTTPGASSEAIRVFWAHGATHLQRTDSSHDFVRQGEEADMQGRWVRLSDLLAAIHGGGIHNPSTIIAALALDRVVQGRATTRLPEAPFDLGPLALREQS